MSSLVTVLVTAAAGSACPPGLTLIDGYEHAGGRTDVCEDLQRPGGALALLRDSSGRGIEWFHKSYEVFGSGPGGSDDNYYLNLTKQAAVADTTDVLAVQLLSDAAGITWEKVADAVPPIRRAGVRTFVGSRGSVADTTFDDAGEDAAGYGFPPPLSYVFNLSNIAEGGSPIMDGSQYINSSLMADGLVGDYLPIVVFYFPVRPDSPYLPPAARGNRSRYWTMIASASPDMGGSREQTVWFRFTQIECDKGVGVSGVGAMCRLVGEPQYWDTYWWSRIPGGAPPNRTGPLSAASASGFYTSLLENRQWWQRELAAEGMMELRLPMSAGTNGTWLWMQAVHHILRGMITWHDTWGPRYGVLPGYGIAMQNGFQDTFTATAMSAIEMGAIPYARGLLEHHWDHFVRYDAMINYRAEEVAQSCRMLTILSLYHDYAADAPLLLRHFHKARAMAEWIIAVSATAPPLEPSPPTPRPKRSDRCPSHPIAARLVADARPRAPAAPLGQTPPRPPLAAPERVARVWRGGRALWHLARGGRGR